MATDFGKDTSCTDRLRSGRLVTGARLVGEAAYRRLTTKRGTLRGGPEEELYGLDLSEEVGKLQSAGDEAALPGRIRTQLLRDERLDPNGIAIVLKKTSEGVLVTYEVEINCQTAAGPFELVLAVSAVSVELLKLEAA